MFFTLEFKLMCNLYYYYDINFNNYRLVLEVVIHGIAIGFAGLEFIIGIYLIVTFSFSSP